MNSETFYKTEAKIRLDLTTEDIEHVLEELIRDKVENLEGVFLKFNWCTGQWPSLSVTVESENIAFCEEVNHYSGAIAGMFQ